MHAHLRTVCSKRAIRAAAAHGLAMTDSGKQAGTLFKRPSPNTLLQPIIDICSSDTLPSISRLDLDKVYMEKGDRQRVPMMSISTGSPTTVSSGPPPYPYSPSMAGSIQNPSGDKSPPESTCRPIKDGNDSPGNRKLLPSIHEALAPTSIPLTPTPPSARAQSLPDAPKGPPNPFLQSIPPTSAIGGPSHLMQTSQSYRAPPGAEPKPSSMAVNNVEPRPPSSQVFGPVQSPRFLPRPLYGSGHHSFSNSYTSHDATPLRSPGGFGVARSPIAFQSQQRNPPPPAFPYSVPFLATRTDQRFSFGRNGPGAPYGDSMKRPHDAFDVELALDEVR
jgi:hypothetical protein